MGGPVVRCYMGDNEQRWFMWYSGRGAGSPDMDALLHASGSVGAPLVTLLLTLTLTLTLMTGLSSSMKLPVRRCMVLLADRKMLKGL